MRACGSTIKIQAKARSERTVLHALEQQRDKKEWTFINRIAVLTNCSAWKSPRYRCIKTRHTAFPPIPVRLSTLNYTGCFVDTFLISAKRTKCLRKKRANYRILQPPRSFLRLISIQRTISTILVSRIYQTTLPANVKLAK